MDIRISMEDWYKLLAAESESGYTLEAWEIGAQAVHDWLARNSPETLSKPCTCGYQWKELFLPKGSLLRTVFNGRHYHCIVEDDGPRFNGEPTSPSRFANAVGGVRRNAWRVIWVLFPNTQEWKLADGLRTRRRAPSRPASRPDAGPRAGHPPSPVAKAGEERGHHQRQAVWPAGGEPDGDDGARTGPRRHAPDGRDQERRRPAERRVAHGERRRGASDAAQDIQRRPAEPCTAAAVEQVAGDAASPGRFPLAWGTSRDGEQSPIARGRWAPAPSFVIRTARYALRRGSSARPGWVADPRPAPALPRPAGSPRSSIRHPR